MTRVRVMVGIFLVTLVSRASFAAPLSPSVQGLISFYVRQIILIDYGMARKFGTALPLKAQALPDNLKQFEISLQGVGVNPDRDLDSLTFFSFDDDKERLEDGRRKIDIVGVASGSYNPTFVLTALALKKIRPVKYHDSDLYPLSKTMSVTLSPDNLLLLGSEHALTMVLNQSKTQTLASNQEFLKRIKLVEKATVWSVLDGRATQDMLTSALGKGSNLQALVNIEDQIQSSYFTMNFKNGIRFDMDFLTSNKVVASQLSTLLKAGVLFKKITANPDQRDALERVTVRSKPVESNSVESNSSQFDLKIRFQADLQDSQRLLQSKCFKAMWNERKELSGITSAQISEDPKLDGQNSSPE